MEDNLLLVGIKIVTEKYPETVKYLPKGLLSDIEHIQTMTVPEYSKAVFIKTIEQYLRMLWNACLEYFRDDIGDFGFLDAMTEAISTQMQKAWNQGARAVGVDPSEYTPEDKAELQKIINKEYNYVLELASDIQNAKAEGMTLAEFRSEFKNRIEIWVNRYRDVVNYAKTWFGGRVKLKWVFGKTKKHCTTCSRLNGIVAYSWEWKQSGVRPQHPPNEHLECGGWKCKCRLTVTKQRRSPNALARLQSIAGG